MTETNRYRGTLGLAALTRSGALEVYAAAGAKDKVELIISKGKGHEMDVEGLVEFMK